MSERKKLLVLGASGLTGLCMVPQALERNYHVTALVRDPTKIEIQNDNLVVAKCNIFNKEELSPHVEKADVVLSCLGFSAAWSEPVPYYREVAMNLSECMKEFGKRRVIFCHSWFTDPASRAKAGFFTRNVFIRFLTGQLFTGMRLSELFLETTDHLDYTCVLPPTLTNGPVTDGDLKTNDTDFCIVPDCSIRLARADVARYMLDVIDDEGSYRKIRAIGIGLPEDDSLVEMFKEHMGDFRRNVLGY